MVRAGQFRQRITIQNKAGVADATGQLVATWTEFATEWARVEPLTGAERFAAQQVVPMLNYKVTIRYRADLADVSGAEEKRIVLDTGAILDIQSILPDERSTVLELLCIERGHE